MESDVQVLLVEDDALDARAIKRAFAQLAITTSIAVAQDGVEALALLRDEVPGRSLRRPYLIILDLNLPRMNGHEFLSVLRNDPKLHDSVVFVHSSSLSAQDIERAYEFNVAGYLTKSVDQIQLMHNMALFRLYIDTVILPA
ncbi:MAG: response regulator [Rhodothermales bacterium]